MYPIYEDLNEKKEDEIIKSYQKNTSRCYSIIKKFWNNRDITIISGEKLDEVVLDIQAIRTDNFDLVDSEEE